MEEDGEKLIKNEEETRSVSSDREGQTNVLRGDNEEANYGGERISFSFKK